MLHGVYLKCLPLSEFEANTSLTLNVSFPVQIWWSKWRTTLTTSARAGSRSWTTRPTLTASSSCPRRMAPTMSWSPANWISRIPQGYGHPSAEPVLQPAQQQNFPHHVWNTHTQTLIMIHLYTLHLLILNHSVQLTAGKVSKLIFDDNCRRFLIRNNISDEAFRHLLIIPNDTKTAPEDSISSCALIKVFYIHGAYTIKHLHLMTRMYTTNKHTVRVFKTGL